MRGKLIGLIRHPVMVSRVVMNRIRVDPAGVAHAAIEALPPWLRQLTRKVARPLARRLRLILGAGPWRDAKVRFDAGRLTDAIELLRKHGTNPLTRRRITYYEGELAAVSPDPIPAAPKVTVAKRAPGRVLHCVTNALPYTVAGYTIRTHRIVTAQRRAGLDPHVVTGWGWPVLQGHVDAEPYEEIDDIPYHRLLPRGADLPSEGRGRMIHGARAVTELVRTLRPEVLHAATDHRNGSVALAARERTGTPVIYEVRGFLEETWAGRDPARVGSERHLLQREREAYLMRSADAVVTLAETMAAEIVARGVPRERIFLAPNAVDDALLSMRCDGSAFRTALGIAPGEVVVGSVSSLVAYEGFGTLLIAAALLRDQGTPVRVLLVGDGTERPALLRQAKELGLKDAVLPGRVGPEEALRAQAAIDIFVCPRADLRVCRLVTPLKPVEAMALGKPIVLSDLPALSELIGDERAGLLLPPADPEALAKALAGLRDDPAKRAEMGEAGRAEVARRRTWRRVASTYRGLYESLSDR